uniref:Uncharacterized protein n=1 Tax=Candidatus Kentrum sp. TUN TaxID=2126343 RepID=A0A450ZET9_9GAMM|nr:MAG: hypothetical protein BECKTUN1418D_GA0071000_10106 [Candidatus Kentron sp. TUN]VFK52312.1 MAG: hypothetical protein BECKTUN1418F_GA0071002_100718 [Candidatus Kentron sp. TUN]VFK52743.1 MAG: hypothetical protein BECKTUN1418E_GA0071001_100918 [Candidatus Kentron sp. TUN]
MSAQQKFVGRLEEYLRIKGLESRTLLSVTEYHMDVPLKAICWLMLDPARLLLRPLMHT